MADTVFLTNDALTRKRWAKDLFPIMLKETEINDLIGRGPDSIIQLRTELGKGEGDKITFGIKLPLTGAGIVGRNPVEGNEEKLIFRDFDTTIQELNHAVNTGGRMEAQRVPYDMLQIAKEGLQYWWADKLTDAAFAHLMGNTAFRIAGDTFAQNPTAPDANHWLWPNARTSDATVSDADPMTLAFLDRLKQQAEVPTADGAYKVRPLRIKGKKYYRVYMHNYAFDKLRTDTNVGQWGDILREAGKLQLPNVELAYNGMLVSKTERAYQSVINATTATSGTYRCVLLGSQSAVMAFGGAGESKSTTMSFVPYETDAKRFINVRGGGIWGIKKTVFQSNDFGVVTGSTWAERL